MLIRLLTPKSGATPSVSKGGVVSASAFGQFTSAAPGSWIEIYGSNLAGNTRLWTGADFSGIDAPAKLDGTSVTIGGQAAFIYYISPTQVNAQVPSGGDWFTTSGRYHGFGGRKRFLLIDRTLDRAWPIGAGLL